MYITVNFKGFDIDKPQSLVLDGLLSVGEGLVFGEIPLVRREVPWLFCEIPKKPRLVGKEHYLDGKNPHLAGKEHCLDGKKPRLVGREHRLDRKECLLAGKKLFGAGTQFFNNASSDI